MNDDDTEPQFTSRANDDRCVVTVSGDIDMATAAAFRRHLEATTQPLVLIDLNHVTYIDSAGIHAVDRALAALTQRQQRVRIIASPNSAAGWTFKVAGFDPAILFPSEAAALA
jgi:anti-anti-sigma factor